jgi:hypothetical protein
MIFIIHARVTFLYVWARAPPEWPGPGTTGQLTSSLVAALLPACVQGAEERMGLHSMMK